jgi:hypothetical protein
MSEKGEKKTIEGQILRKLENIEKQLNEKIRNIEASLERINESSTLITDDQLFFGFVFSLALLILTLPAFDVSTLFESFGFEIREASGIATTKDVIVILLIVASVLRYVVTFSKEPKRKNQLRIFSVNLVLGSFYLLISDFFLRGLGDLFLKQNPFLVILAPTLLVVFSISFGLLVEKRWYQYYSPSYVSKTSQKPQVSFAFAFVGIFVVLLYSFAILADCFITSSFNNVLLVLGISTISSIILFLLIVKITEKL